MSEIRQAIVDTAITKLFEQGTASVINRNSLTNAMCQYRLPKEDGVVLKCAIGHLIPDEDYTPEMEGKSAYSLFTNYIGLFEKIITKLGFDPADLSEEDRETTIFMMRHIQRIHDNTVNDADTPEAFIESIRSALHQLAVTYNGISIEHLLKD